MENKYIRKNRKACLKQKGEYNFGFYEFHEFCIYKYAMGIKMKKKEYNDVCEHNRFNSYKEWKTYILKKYENMDADDCKELKKFLTIKSKNKKTQNSVYIVVMTSFYTVIFSKIFEIVVSNLNFDSNKSNITLKMQPFKFLLDMNLTTNRYPAALGIVLNFLIPIVIVGVLACVICYLLKSYWNENETSSFYEDYISTIDELISRNDKGKKKISKRKNNGKTSSSQNGRRNKNTNYSNTH